MMEKMQDFDLRFILGRMRRGWLTPICFALMCILVALHSLAGARPVYRVEMLVIPTPASQPTSGGNVGGALTSLLGIEGGAQNGTDYKRYQKLISSPAVAQLLQTKYGMLQKVFASEWDKKDRKWVAPQTLRRSLLGWLFALAHVPEWTPPNATTLSAYLQSALVIIPSTTDDIVSISMDSSDVAFAKHLMVAADTEANALLRDQVARRARQQAAYLERKLAQTTVADYRATLLNLLASQQKTLMLTQTQSSFAAEIVSGPTASPVPISPRPILSLVVAILVGTLVGFAVVIFLGPYWWRAPYEKLIARSASARGRRNSANA